MAEEKSGGKEQAEFTFRVKDSGCGISAENLEVIFDAFEQVDGDNTGKVPGTGSEFYFTVPIKLSECQMPGEPVKPEVIRSAEMLSEKRILLAEDNDLNAEIAQTLLGSYNYQVERMKSGKEAVKGYLQKPEGYYDLILMDIQIPVMDGLTAARKIRKSGKPGAREIPIIAMSANAFKEDVGRSLNAGMNAHTTKPIEIEKLVALLDTYLTETKE